ncbi:MAG: B12-binding domain-containing radical SAM protein [Coprococcus sp.]|nr:B12-binding domain-containing radical SAM protein [Coprococcus sp.]
MKILLTAVNAKYIHSNLAIYSLKAYAEKYADGADIFVMEFTINQQTDEILRGIYREKPDMLCLSCYIWNWDHIVRIVREVKKVLPDVILWLGGPEVSYDGAAVLKSLPEADGVMKGEGEQTFAELAAYYQGKQGKRLSDIPGIVYRAERACGADKEIRENDWREVIDLSSVPFVYQDMEPFRHKIIYYESSRGCPFSCSYCLSSIDKCLRFRDLDLVKRELQFFLDHNVEQVKFVDRTFNCRHAHAIAIWKYILEHDNGLTNFHFEISADLLNEEELELMGRMRPGLIQLEIGVQSTNPDTIREIHRTMQFSRLSENVRRIHSYGNIHQHVDLIAGLPYEDYESFGKSFDAVYDLAPEQLQLGFLKVLKGSEMEKQKEKYELLHKSFPPYEALSTRWLPYQDMIRLKEIEEMVEVYYNSRQFCYTLKYLTPKFPGPFAFFESLAGYYRKNGLDEMNHSRILRYEILLRFVKEWNAGDTEQYRQLLTLDYYLRENAASRPDFAGEDRMSKEALRDFYDREASERKYLYGYDAYDKRKLRKMTHIEEFTYDVTGDMKEKRLRILFDYKNRSPLDHQARIVSCKNTAGSIQ